MSDGALAGTPAEATGGAPTQSAVPGKPMAGWRRFVRPAVAALLALLVVLTATGHVDLLLAACGLKVINSSNEQYLQESFDQSLKGFLVLSVIKAGVAVLEGSEVGVGFSLQIGDMAQSVYDYIDIAWKASLAGGVILLLMRLILQTVQAVDQWFLFLALLAGLTLYLSCWIFPDRRKGHRLIREALFLCACLAAALYIVLPVSVAGAAFLSRRITQPLVAEAHEGFGSVEKELSVQALNDRIFPPSGSSAKASFWSQLDVKEKFNESIEALKRLSSWLRAVTEDFAEWTIKLIAGYVFDCFIFPLAFFVAAYILTRSLIAYMFGVTRSQKLREDLDSVVARYFRKTSDAPEKQ